MSLWVNHSTERLPHTLLGRFHPEVRWVVGRTKACVEGRRGNSEAIQEMLCGIRASYTSSFISPPDPEANPREPPLVSPTRYHILDLEARRPALLRDKDILGQRGRQRVGILGAKPKVQAAAPSLSILEAVGHRADLPGEILHRCEVRVHPLALV